MRRLEADAPVKVVAELSQRAYERDSEALEALARYARDGRLVGMRDYVVAALAKAATANASFLEANFREVASTDVARRPPILGSAWADQHAWLSCISVSHWRGLQ